MHCDAARLGRVMHTEYVWRCVWMCGDCAGVLHPAAQALLPGAQGHSGLLGVLRVSQVCSVRNSRTLRQVLWVTWGHSCRAPFWLPGGCSSGVARCGLLRGAQDSSGLLSQVTQDCYQVLLVASGCLWMLGVAQFCKSLMLGGTDVCSDCAGTSITVCPR